jgi:predicted nucleic acid-binding protein
MTNIFIDTSAFYASFDPEDENYQTSAGFFNEIKENSGYRLFTTNLVFYETVTLIRSRIGIAESIRFGQNLRQSNEFHAIFVDQAREAKAFELFTGHTDKNYSFVDCASFVIMKELGIQKAFAFDKHFKQFGFEQIP